MPGEAGRRPRPARRLALAVALTAAFALLCCTGGAAGMFFDAADQGEIFALSASDCGEGGPVDVNGPMPSVASYSSSQLRNAAVIIRVGADLKVPPRGWVIAVATAMQESTLNNLPHLGTENDHDSVGLFQQRPSQGWGRPAQLRDPAYSARKFYQKLLTVKGWQTMPLTEAAQRVQVSAYPDAYAKHEPVATEIVNLLASGAARSVRAGEELRCAGAGEVAASGWTHPVPGSVGSGFRTGGRPDHHGVDIAAPKGTVIRAAAAGRVLVSQCDPDQYGRLSCNVDGSPAKQGCGWFVDILHAGNVVTRYCHMVEKPLVNEGDRVAAGQQIGKVGSSGNSSGPHLHFEVHRRGDRSAAGAVDPVPFMRQRGAAFGKAT
ncbi:M23 family metallopeptidase [Micromonospora pattaloongensis]|nr:M23 family metallopeptidase [Micromonospora pattaloongensis]